MQRNFDKKTSLAQAIQVQQPSEQQNGITLHRKVKFNGRADKQNRASIKINITGCQRNSINNFKNGEFKPILNCSEPVFHQIGDQTADTVKCKRNITFTKQLTNCLYQMQNPNHQNNFLQNKVNSTVRRDSQPKSQVKRKLKMPKINQNNWKKLIEENNNKNNISLVRIQLQGLTRKQLKLNQSPAYTQRQAIQRRNQIVLQKLYNGCVKLERTNNSSQKQKIRRGNMLNKQSHNRQKDICMTIVRQEWKKTNQINKKQIDVLDRAFDYNGSPIELKKNGQLSKKFDEQFIRTNSKLKQKEELKKFGNAEQFRLSIKNSNKIDRNISQMMKAITINNFKHRDQTNEKDLVSITNEVLTKSLSKLRLKTQL